MFQTDADSLVGSRPLYFRATFAGSVTWKQAMSSTTEQLEVANEEGDDEDAEGGTRTRRYVGSHVTQGPNRDE